MEEMLDRLQLLRVVRCLPSRADVRGRDDATRAGVVQASREETAASPDVRSVELSRYGDSMGRRWARWRHPVDELADDIARMWDGDAPRWNSVMTQRPRRHALAAKVKPSAIGSDRRKADILLMQTMSMLMPRLATPVGRGSFPRERRFRRCASRRRSADRRRSAAGWRPVPPPVSALRS
jgi:hypothetical protein